MLHRQSIPVTLIKANRSRLFYLADVCGLELEEIDSSSFKLVLRVVRAHQLQVARVALTAEDLDEDVGVGAGSVLLASLHRYVIRCRYHHMSSNHLPTSQLVKKVKAQVSS